MSYKFRLFRTTPALSTSHMVRPVHSDAVIEIAQSFDLYLVFFLKGQEVCCNILHLPKEQYVINPCFDPDDLYEALTGAQAQ